LNSVAKTLLTESLDVWRGDKCLFSGLSFSLEAGQVALVMGPNGSGKTSLLRVLAGLTPAADGHVRWGTVPVQSLPFEERAHIAYRGHLEGLKKDFTVRENLDFYCALWGNDDDPGPLLDELGLGDIQARRMKHLSAGQKRRLSLATLKVCGATLWILDEPMTNLDAGGRRLAASWVREHTAEGGSAVIATHQPRDFEDVAAITIEL
jgi:heme exporter protein A